MGDHSLPIATPAVSAVLIRGAGAAAEVLLLRRTGLTLAGEWCQVSGGIEPGETAWEAALREIHEETGLVPDRLYSADLCEQFYDPVRNRVNVFPVFVGFVGADARVTLNAEHDAYRWMPFAEAVATVTFPGQRAMLAHVQREFVDRPPTEWLRIAMR